MLPKDLDVSLQDLELMELCEILLALINQTSKGMLRRDISFTS